MTVLLVLLGFGPPLAWMAVVRWADRWEREPFWGVLVAFGLGAFGVVAAVVTVGAPVAVVLPEPVYVVLGAPVIEEAAKLLALLVFGVVARRLLDEPVDAAVYAATVGFGFAAAENVQYFAAASSDAGLLAVLFVLRSGGTAVMHGVAAGLAGVALGDRMAGRDVPSVWRRGWPAAVALHAAWNLLSYLGAAGLAGGMLLLLLATARYVVGFRRLLAASPRRLANLPPPMARLAPR